METKLIDVTDLENAKARLAYAGSVLRAGGLVAFPTETVYGLGGDALNPNAAADIYQAKGRPSDNPLIVHIADKEELSLLTDKVSLDAEKLMEAFWPGPLTMIFEKKPEVPWATTGGLDTVAVRMPDHPAALALIREAGCPLSGPSANLSGRPSPTRWEHVYEDLNGRIDVILQAEPCRVGIESTVVDMTGDIPVILRPGILTPDQMEGVVSGKVVYDPALFVNRPRDVSPEAAVAAEKKRGKSGVEAGTAPGGGCGVEAGTAYGLESGRGRGVECGLGSGVEAGPEAGALSGGECGPASEPAPKSPGMKYRHYAPRAEMILYQGAPDRVRRAVEDRRRAEEAKGKKTGVLLFEGEDARLVARDFFAALRRMDSEGVDLILAAALDKRDPVSFSVMNRMLKSAGYHIVEV